MDSSGAGADPMASGASRPEITVAKVPLPSGGGSIAAAAGSYSTDESSGTATFTIPLAHSCGRDFEPAPSLRYTSNGGAGPFGLGVSLPSASITRSTLFGVPRYRDDDLFAYSGQLLVPLGSRTVTADGTSYAVTSYAPRLQTEFALIERWIAVGGDSFWRVVDPDNHISVYGRTAAARIADPANPTRVFEWLIEAEYDASGNAISYVWLAEDGANIAPSLCEIGRGPPCQRYIGAIRYALAAPFDRGPWGIAPAAPGPWHVEILFDYGQYDPSPANPDPYTPTGSWRARADPFSSYTSGFEVRTHRLCRNILLFHRFDALGPAPVLVHVTRLTYAEDASLSLLTRIDSLGYSRDAGADPPYRVQPLPPIELGYAGFDPLIGMFTPLTVSDGTPPPDFPASSAYAFADLDRIGAPGLLYADGSSTLFWPPSPTGGTATLAPAEPLASFPIERVAQGSAHLMDVEGDGDLDLMIARPSQTGYYPSAGARAWQGFRAFDQVPTDLGARDANFADLAGTGRSDLVAHGALGIDYHASLGADGFAPAATHIGPADLPPQLGAWPDQIVTFGDPFGTGGTHMIRVTDGCLECWPGLGYGVFGAKVTLGGLPLFGPTFDARFVILADIDQSGPADLLYIDGDGVVLCRNQAGNGFAPPVRLPLPVAVATPGQVAVLDLGGTGTSHLLVSDASLPVASWSYAFNDAVKPWLLTTVDNNMGGTATITYGSSTRHYLEDLRDGVAWVTRLAFPVHVVDRVVQQDRVSQSSTTISYRYRHGRYDGAERQFLGFGEVQRQDADRFDDEPPPPTAASSRATFAQAAANAPPRLTRTWYGLGATGAEAIAIDAAFTAEWFAGDPGALALAPALCVWLPGGTPDAEDARQAQVALHGQPLRVEIYGLDGSPAETIPYQVQHYRYRVDELVGRGDGPFAVFMVHACETITYDYDRDPADPATRHSFTLAVDPEDGETRLDCHVAYPRRGTAPSRWQAAQFAQLVTCNTYAYGRFVDDANHRLGVLTEWCEYELDGLRPGTDGYYTLDAVAAQVGQALAGTGGCSADYMQWERFTYWDETTQGPRPAGDVGPRALLTTTASADFSAATITALFAGVLDDATLETTLADALYVHDTASGWWWIPGDVQSFHDATAFYLPASVTLPFGATIDYRYDATGFALIQTTERADGVLDHVVTVDRFDYQTLQPTRVIDPNRNTEEVRFDALGKAVLTSRYGKQMGKPVGFAPIVDTAWTAPASPAALLADPAAFLGSAASVLAYDLLAWCGRCEVADLAALGDTAAPAWAALVTAGYLSPEGAILAAFRAVADANGLDLPPALAPQRAAIYSLVAACARGTPVCWALVTAQVYPDASAQPPMIEVQFNDGFGRTVQRKQQAPPGLAQGENGTLGAANERWVTSGAARYDSRGRVYMRFDPFFATSWQFTDDPTLCAQGTPGVYFYDVLDRETQVLTPKGLLRRAVFTPWTVTRWDENDSVRDSPYWLQHPGGAGLEPLEWQALQKAALCADTPTVYHSDALGRVIAIVAQTSRTLGADAFVPLGLSSAQSAQLYADLQAQGYLDPLGALTIAFQTGTPLVLPPEFEPYADHIAQILEGLVGGGRPLVSLFGRDAAGEDIWSVDPRLFAQWPANSAGPLSFATSYSLTGRRLVVISADGGTLHRIQDAVGHDFLVQDGRGIRITTGFDALRRIQTVQVTDVAAGAPARTLEWYVYGDQLIEGTPIVPDPYSFDLIDEVHRQFDQAGLREIAGYSLGGSVLASSQRLRTDPTASIDWGSVEPDPQSPALAVEAYAFAWQVDALNRIVVASTPAGTATTTHRNLCGQVDTVQLVLADGTTAPVVDAATYNANGQLETLARGNGVAVQYQIDPLDFRLTGITATRSADGLKLQDMRFFYDPVGNLSHASDAAFAALWGDDCGSDGAADYRYDALYRLTGATTPVRSGYTAALEQQGGYQGLTVPMNGGQMAPNVLETASWANAFDDAGNAYWTTMMTGTVNWQSEMVVVDQSNRAVSTILFDGSPAAATAPVERTVPAADLVAFFDANGNQTKTETAKALAWDYRNTLRAASAADTTLALDVDAQGDVIRRVETVGDTVIDTLMLGDFERVRTVTGGGPPSDVVRTKARCNALLAVEAITVDGATTLYHRLGDLALSARLATTQDGTIVTAEAYTPFGATAFAVSFDAAAQDAVEERYQQVARDRTTGLYRYPARWYAPWLRRWLSPDPLGQVDGMNLYAFVSGNPASNVDPLGKIKITLSDGSVIDFDHLQTIEALQEAVDLIRSDVSKNPLTSTGTARKMAEYTVKNEGDLLRLAFDPKLRGDFATKTAVSPYAMKFGAMEFTEKRLGKEPGVHGTIVIKGGGMIGYDEITPTATPQDEARRLSHLFRVTEVPKANDANAGIVPVMAISESDRSEIGGLLGLIELQNIKYGKRTFDQAYVNGNDPYFIGAKKTGGAKALKSIDRKRRGVGPRKSQVMTRRQTAKIKASLETFVSALDIRPNKVSKFAAALTSADVKAAIRDHIMRKAGFKSLGGVKKPQAMAKKASAVVVKPGS
jgi:RHS repeat-associated protein